MLATLVDTAGPRASRALVLLACFSAIWLSPGVAAAHVFAFTDARGVLHVTNKPRGDRRFRLLVRTRRAAPDRDPSPAPPAEVPARRAARYAGWIGEAAARYRIPEALVRAVIECESGYDPRAVSPAGAEGLMQLMPATALRMEVRDSFDPRDAIFGGVRYLRALADTFGGDVERVVAAYNAGEGAVTRYGGVPPYDETRRYVAEVLGRYRRYRARRAGS